MNITGKKPGRERRHDIRRECSKFVEIMVQGRTYLGCIKNESKGGLFIEAKGSFGMGQDISLTYPSPVAPDHIRTGKIVKIMPSGIGVKYNYPGYLR